MKCVLLNQCVFLTAEKTVILSNTDSIAHSSMRTRTINSRDPHTGPFLLLHLLNTSELIFFS